MKIKIISWNVNGIRASIKKGLWAFVKRENADIYCFQEIKAKIDQIPNSIDRPTGYFEYWNPAERAGYSGVGMMTKLEPKTIINGDRDSDWDDEGRVIITKFDEFSLLNVYFPNGKRDLERLDFKMKFYEHFLNYINKLRENGEKVIFCGDVNTAHTEIDLARPGANRQISGFLDVERAWIDKVIKAGYIDTFRKFDKNGEKYSWWSPRGGARNRNVGWRIDYVFVDKSLKDKVKNAFILDEVMGSDHCPVGIELEI